jgi:cell division transport system permease protein
VGFASPYVLRETGGNLVRNIVMTVAAVVTMAVSLSALGSILVMRQAVNMATLRWQGGVQLAIYMNSTASKQEILAIRQELNGMEPQEVQRFWYVDKEEAWQEFKQMFSNQPDLIKVMNVSAMPPSFRVVPAKAQNINNIGTDYERQAGVNRVLYPGTFIQDELERFATLRNGILVGAAGVMLGAVALMVNTIQLAIFARRREVAVMKLVGATNWFIRVPFMLEGLLEGLVGAVIAGAIVYFSRVTISSLTGDTPLDPTQQVTVGAHGALVTGLLLLVIGAAVGGVGSGFAVRRFLKV